MVGIIAGGDAALRRSVEAAEDDPAEGARAIGDRDVCPVDVVVGIAAGGRTPYVLGALDEAHRLGARTGLLSVTPPDDEVGVFVDMFVTPIVGPEIVTGSTRLKAGTATKLILNQITTVHLGELYCQLLGVVQDRYGGEHCQRVGFKQTWVEALVPAIQNSFPDTRIVHVIRDPRSVIASWREADDLTHQYPFLMMIRHWRKSVGFASLGSVRNANYVVVRYEDFVAQPSVVADRIWDTCALARVSVDPQSFRDGKGQSWMTNTSYAKSDGITSSHVSSWEERLSEGEVKIIEHLCGPEMAWAGYEAVTDTMSLAPFLEQADLYRTKGKTEWISQYADAFALNGENMAKEAGRWLIAREIATLGEGVDSDLSRAMFLDPGILTRV